jgi:hypothetical protein
MLIDILVALLLQDSPSGLSREQSRPVMTGCVELLWTVYVLWVLIHYVCHLLQEDAILSLYLCVPFYEDPVDFN